MVYSIREDEMAVKEKIKVVLDRGFYSAVNINALYKHHLEFLIAAKISLKVVKTNLDTVRDTMRS